MKKVHIIINFQKQLAIYAVLFAALSSGSLWADSRIISVESSESRTLAVISGTVTPYKAVTLTAQLPGRVNMIAGVEGDRFKQGDQLVSLEIADLQAKRRSVEAQLANAQSALQNAQVQYSRELYSPQSESISAVPGMGMPKLRNPSDRGHLYAKVRIAVPTVLTEEERSTLEELAARTSTDGESSS